MEREDWPGGLQVRVRVGLHAGEADPGESDWRGVAVNRCARIRALAHGGQVLVSGAVRELAGDDLPPGASLRDLGLHRLRDLERPEHLFQLAHPDLPRDFPPLHSAGARRHNLLLQLTSFVGRERELDELATLLDGARLVTLTGAGGSGKTRLAMEVAATQAERMRDGAWFVDLAPVFDPQLVLKAVAQVLGVRERPHSDLLDDILERVRESELLLVLDNCEHLVEACARLAEDLLRACPELRLLATSREPLGVPGERVFRTGSLAVPAADDAPDAIARAESVVLFGDRARRRSAASSSLPTRPRWWRTSAAGSTACRSRSSWPPPGPRRCRWTTSDRISTTASRCSRAARGRRCRVSGRSRRRSPGATSCSASASARLFDRLSVFAGGWTLDAAETVCASAGIETRHVADDLAALVDKSLVVRVALEGRRTRYRLLETLRQYGRERLRETGEARRRSRCPPQLGRRARRGGRAPPGRARTGGVARSSRARARQPAGRAGMGDHLAQRRGGPAPCLDHDRQPVDVAFARARGPAVAAASAGHAGRGRRERAGQGPAGRRAGRLPGRPVDTRDAPVRAESRALSGSGGGGRARRAR